MRKPLRLPDCQRRCNSYVCIACIAFCSKYRDVLIPQVVHILCNTDFPQRQQRRNQYLLLTQLWISFGFSVFFLHHSSTYPNSRKLCRVCHRSSWWLLCYYTYIKDLVSDYYFYTGLPQPMVGSPVVSNSQSVHSYCCDDILNLYTRYRKIQNSISSLC